MEVDNQIATTSSNPATAVVDNNRQVGMLKVKRKKRKQSKKKKKYIAKKKKFAKKVRKVMIKMGPANIYKESCTGTYNLNGYATANQAWNNTMDQTWTFSNALNSSGGFWFGGRTTDNQVRDKDLYKLLDYQNNEVFLYNTNSGIAQDVGKLQLQNAANNVNYIQTSAKSGRVWITAVKYTLSIRNRSSTATICVDVYDMVAQKNYSVSDNFKTAQSAYENCLLEENFTYDTTGAANAAVSTEVIRLDEPQTTPFDIPNYSKYWKAKTGTRLLLEPNQTKMLTFYGPKGWYDGRRYEDLVAIAGHTTEFLFICGAGPSPGMVAGIEMPSVTWTKEIIWRQEVGYGKPANMPLSKRRVF